MRRKPWEVEAIRQELRSLDPEADVDLFGSRVDDEAPGGDIDLLVVSRRIGDGDRINRAEKKGLVKDAEAFRERRELRNRIAHEYVPTAVQTIFREVLDAVPALLDSGDRVRAYCKRYAAQGEK